MAVGHIYSTAFQVI